MRLAPREISEQCAPVCGRQNAQIHPQPVAQHNARFGGAVGGHFGRLGQRTKGIHHGRRVARFGVKGHQKIQVADGVAPAAGGASHGHLHHPHHAAQRGQNLLGNRVHLAQREPLIRPTQAQCLNVFEEFLFAFGAHLGQIAQLASASGRFQFVQRFNAQRLVHLLHPFGAKPLDFEQFEQGDGNFGRQPLVKIELACVEHLLNLVGQSLANAGNAG